MTKEYCEYFQNKNDNQHLKFSLNITIPNPLCSFRNFQLYKRKIVIKQKIYKMVKKKRKKNQDKHIFYHESIKWRNQIAVWIMWPMHLITRVEKEIRDKELPTKVKVNSHSLLTRSSPNKKETSLVEDRGYLVRKAFMLYYYIFWYTFQTRTL